MNKFEKLQFLYLVEASGIGAAAFHTCSGLVEIINQRVIPQILHSDGGYLQYTYTFEGVNKIGCTLFVPAGSEIAYRTADGWKDFVNHY